MALVLQSTVELKWILIKIKMYNYNLAYNKINT